MRHLAIFVDDYIEKILKREKTVEGRFSLNKIVPFSAIKKDDEILLKQSGGDVIGKVRVENVLFYENLDAEMIGKLRKEYDLEMCVDSKWWQSKANSRYASLIFLKKPTRFLAPIKHHKKDRRSWVILEDR